MGLFDDDTSGKRDEVRIGISDRDSGSKLREDVENKVTDSRDSSSHGSGRSIGSGDVSLEDIHDQNKRIIELLESIKKDSSDIGGSSISDNISDRRNSGRDKDDDDQGMRGGMDELL